MSESKIIVALDDPNFIPTMEGIDPRLCKVKIGKRLFTKYGPSVVRRLQNLGFDIFLDLKFHDIPNTVADAVEAAADMGVWMVNLHALGGKRMMAAAKERLEKGSFLRKPKLIAVTVLTSTTEKDLQDISLMHTPNSLVWSLAISAYQSGMDGIVCSPHELKAVKYSSQMDNNYISVVPGVRPLGSPKDDQERVATPEEAVINGAKYVVMGRPILNAKDPLHMLNAYNAALQNPSIDVPFISV